MLAIPRRDVRRDLTSRDLRGELGNRALIVGELEPYTPTAARTAASGATLRPPS